MALKDVLRQFLEESGLNAEIKHDDDDDVDFIATRFPIGGQNYELELITDEKRQLLRVTLTSPIKVPKPRAKDTAFLLNFINRHMPFGSLVTDEDGIVYYTWAIDVEGATAAPKQFENLVGAANAAFDEMNAQAIGAAAFSKQTPEDIIKDFEDTVKKLSEKSDEPPLSL